MPSLAHSDHRLARLMTWWRVWCVMALRLLPERGGLGPFEWRHADALRAYVRDARIYVMTLVLMRAIKRLGPIPNAPRFYGVYGRAALSNIRAAYGWRLRRALAGGTVRAQICAMLALLRDPEAAIARMVRRLKGGLRRPILHDVVRALLSAPVRLMPAPLAANSS